MLKNIEIRTALDDVLLVVYNNQGVNFIGILPHPTKQRWVLLAVCLAVVVALPLPQTRCLTNVEVMFRADHQTENVYGGSIADIGGARKTVSTATGV
jgi:hypothetical protein